MIIEYWLSLLWMLYWLALFTAATAAIYLIVVYWGFSELDEYHRELRQRINHCELEYLKTGRTRSRIVNKPDL